MEEPKKHPFCEGHTKMANNQASYVLEAERRHKRKEKQKQCPHCKKWFWKDEM